MNEIFQNFTRLISSIIDRKPVQKESEEDRRLADLYERVQQLLSNAQEGSISKEDLIPLKEKIFQDVDTFTDPTSTLKAHCIASEILYPDSKSKSPLIFHFPSDADLQLPCYYEPALIKASGYFKTLFSTSLKQTQSREVIVQDISREYFIKTLSALFGNQPEFPNDSSPLEVETFDPAFVSIALHLSIPSLVTKYVDFFEIHFNPSISIHIDNLAQLLEIGIREQESLPLNSSIQKACTFALENGSWDSLPGIIKEHLNSFVFPRPLSTDSRLLQKVIADCPNLKTLSVVKCNSFSDEELRLISNCTQLVELNLSGCRKLSDATFQEILKGCPKLKTLAVEGCNQLSHVGLTSISQCMHLEELNVSKCENFVDETLQEVARNCPHLKALDLAYCIQLSSETLGTITQCSHLKKLNLFGCNLTDHALQRVISGCSNLEDLNLAYCDQLSSQGLSALSHCPHLKELNLTECRNLTDETLQAILENCLNLETLNLTHCYELFSGRNSKEIHGPRLKTLYLAGCKDLKGAAFKEILVGCPQLESLNVSNCGQLSSEGMGSLSEATSLKRLDLSSCRALADDTLQTILMHCPNLEFLNLSHCDQLSSTGIIGLLYCPHLKGLSLSSHRTLKTAALATVIKSCPHLETLNLALCSELSSSDLKAISRCTNLKTLDLSFCDLNGKVLQAIATHCHRLESLELDSCSRISREEFYSIATLQHLKNLSLGGCQTLTNDALKAITNGCLTLESLSLRHCGQLSADALSTISKCQQLKTLDLSHCNQLTDDALRKIVLGCFNLETVELDNCDLLSKEILATYAHLEDDAAVAKFWKSWNDRFSKTFLHHLMQK